MERLRKRKVSTSIKFSPPPHFQDLINKDLEADFNKLPATHRTYISTLIKTQNLEKAAELSNLSTEVFKSVDRSLLVPSHHRDEMLRQGIDIPQIVSRLGEALEGKVVRYNKKTDDNEVFTDPSTICKAAKLLLEIYRGDYEPRDKREKSATDLFREDDDTDSED